MPDTTLLPDDILPNEKKIKELQAQIREIQNARPRLRLAFVDRSDRTVFTFQRSTGLASAEVASRITALRTDYPEMQSAPQPRQADKGPARSFVGDWSDLMDMSGILTAIKPEEIKQYNERLAKFYKDYEKYLEKLALLYDWETRTAPLRIFLLNEGTSPADDIDVFLHFPDGFILFDQGNYPKSPEEPQPPRKPISLAEQLSRPIGIPHDLTGFYSSRAFDHRSLDPPSNVGSPKIKRTNSYDVSVKINRSKHGIAEPLEVMYINFPSSATKKNFRVDYLIHASNLPKETAGSLNIIV